MKTFSLVFPVFLFLFSCKSSQSDFERFANQDTRFSYHIKNARIMDGTGGSAYMADVLIRADTIAYIGEVDSSLISVPYTLDANRNILCPGFIDPHAHGDPLQDPGFQNFLAMGVTSICLGQDGYHAPEKDLNVWLKKVAAQKPGVNILPFVGHGTLRELSDIRFEKNPSPEKIETMIGLLNDALVKGAWGMSTGLEYRPGYYAGEEELAELAKSVGAFDRLIMSHIRNEDDDQVEASIQELIKQGEHCRVHVSHMKSVYGKGSRRADQLLALLDSARKQDIRITADVYPYMASYTGIGIVFPDWALPPNDYDRVKRDRPYQLEGFLLKKILQRNGPQATLFGTAPYAGKNLAQLSREMGKPYEKILMEDIGPKGASAAYFIMNESLQSRLIEDPYVMISSDGSPTMRHPRGYGSFAKIIETYVLEKYLFSLEEAIHKMTGLTAKTLGMENRGIVSVGNKADLLVFDPHEFKANATYESPHELATGLTAVWVNGQLVMQEDNFMPEREGKVLKAPFKLP